MSSGNMVFYSKWISIQRQCTAKPTTWRSAITSQGTAFNGQVLSQDGYYFLSSVQWILSFQLPWLSPSTSPLLGAVLSPSGCRYIFKKNKKNKKYNLNLHFKQKKILKYHWVTVTKLGDTLARKCQELGRAMKCCSTLKEVSQKNIKFSPGSHNWKRFRHWLHFPNIFF